MDNKEKETFFTVNSPPVVRALATFSTEHHIPYFALQKKAIQAFHAPCCYPLPATEYHAYLKQSDIQAEPLVEAWDALVANRNPYDAELLILTDAETALDYRRSGEWPNGQLADNFDDEHRFFWVRNGTLMSGNYTDELLAESPMDLACLAKALADRRLPKEFADPLLPPDADPRECELGTDVATAVAEFRKKAEENHLQPKESNQMLIQMLQSLAPERTRAYVK